MSRLRTYSPLVLLLILSLLFFYKLAFMDMILARGDTYHYFYPYWDARNEAFRAGEFPLWSNDIFMGIPLLADPQIGSFYPPNYLLNAFTAPDAIRYSILLHVFWTSLGTFFLFRQVINRGIFPALVAAAIFGLGGYIGAHVEQINQLQGLSWLPWLLYLFSKTIQGEKRWFWLILLSMAWALQIFTGHTQTTFLSGLVLGIFAIFQSFTTSEKQLLFSILQLKTLFLNGIMLAGAAFIAVLLAIPQLLPTLELIGMSNRGSGLNANQATAFSLSPLYLGRALLPSYDGQLFGEYIGYVGVIALVLAIYGALSAKQKETWLWISLAGIGIFLALGRFNPAYWLLAELPGFNLFRVPARWLAVYALGTAMLAGYGVLSLQTERIVWKRLGIATIPVILLIVAAAISPIDPIDVVGSAMPTMASYLGWATALGIFALIIMARQRRAATDTFVIVVASAVIVELFLASLVMPFNDLAPRDVYVGQRFTISQMLAYQEGQVPQPRMLAISRRLFDVGDISNLQARYERLGMDEQAQATAFTAVKNQETLFPNLPLAWGIPTIDGYGGGLIPTIYYTQFTSLLLPEGSLRTVDGRLAEFLALPECRGACIPDLDYLVMTGTRYLITDKVSDVPIDGVFYDTAMANFWNRGIERPDFDFTEIRVLLRDESLQVFDWETFETFLVANSENILAVSAVDSRTSAFVQLQPQGIERVLSSDVKIYDLGEVPRAYLATDVQILPDDWQGHEDALVQMQAENFVALESAVIHGEALSPLSGRGTVEFLSYSATRIELRVNADSATYLVLNDAYYEGWRATVNGEESPVYRANVLFRAVEVPAGESIIIFEFVPNLWYGSMLFGVLMWGIFLIGMLYLWRKKGQARDLS